MNPENMKIFLLADGAYRGAILDGTDMLFKMREKHQTGVFETYALGESYIAAGLMTSMLKGNDRLAFIIECGGPLKGINVEVNASGDVRGYLKNNPIPMDSIPESLDLSDLIGPGFLSVTKYLENSKSPFTGQVMITYGSIARDLAYYFTVSENIPTAFNLSVKFTSEGELNGAGGLFIQKMPGENEPDAGNIEDAVVSMPSIGRMLAGGMKLSDIIYETFHEYKPDVIGSRDIGFRCSCSRELFTAYIKGLDSESRRDIRENGPFPLVTTCHNCNTSYSFSRSEICSILK